MTCTLTATYSMKRGIEGEMTHILETITRPPAVHYNTQKTYPNEEQGQGYRQGGTRREGVGWYISAGVLVRKGMACYGTSYMKYAVYIGGVNKGLSFVKTYLGC